MSSAAQKIGHLKLTGLRKQYGKLEVLKGVDLDVAPGEFVTLLGPSGSGKTTILMLVAGFQTPAGGTIEVDGIDVTQVPAHRRNVGVVFQHYALFPHMNIRDNVGYPLKMRGVSAGEIRQRVDRELAAVQLADLEKRLPAQLSGGQQQRIAVARATVYRPPILLMDEPLSALDKSLRHDLQAEIRRLHRDLATSIVYVTHDQEEALGMSDRIAVMHDGRIVQLGTPEAIYSRPKTRFVARFVGQSNFLAGRYRASDGGRGRCVLPNGKQLSGIPATAIGDGDAVSLMIRPEHIRVQPPGGADEGVRVRITDVIYQGRWSRCIGEFETGEPCVLELPAGSVTAGAEETLHVGWPGDRAVILPERD